MKQVQELEQAILARAERLAAEYRERARRKRDSILREAAEKLRLREQREEAIAKALGERTFRQRVQASELKMQGHLDRVRWNLVTDVERGLKERTAVFKQDEAAYLKALKAYISQAAQQIEADELVAALNQNDLQALEDQWTEIAKEAAPEKSIRLSPEPIETLGGVLLTSADNRIRVDNTFEGRLDRLRNHVQQVILERLLPSTSETGNLFSG
ncbi:MAG: V-type ATP synthase subunit E family protein [Pseudomonadota bacterium]|nr:V-type ATP synthase subunit E family protein [Pseudomonadota bacterium]